MEPFTIQLTLNPVTAPPDKFAEYLVVTSEGLCYLCFYTPSLDVCFTSEFTVKNVLYWAYIDTSIMEPKL